MVTFPTRPAHVCGASTLNPSGLYRRWRVGAKGTAATFLPRRLHEHETRLTIPLYGMVSVLHADSCRNHFPDRLHGFHNEPSEEGHLLRNRIIFMILFEDSPDTV